MTKSTLFLQNKKYRRTLSRNDNGKQVSCRVTNRLTYDFNGSDAASFSEIHEFSVTCTYFCHKLNFVFFI